MSSCIFIGLGSNLDDPLAQVIKATKALAELPNTELIAVSPWYQSAPIGPAQPDFINGAAKLATTLSPIAMLDALQAIEQAHQRVRELHWGPRTLDLDILLWGEQVIDEPRLQVPHPFLKERAFALQPLLDIEPDTKFPCGMRVYDALVQCDQTGLKQLAATTQETPL